MLGYATAKKGYRLINIQTHVIFLSCYVTFKEHIFPLRMERSTVIIDLFASPLLVNDWMHEEATTHHENAFPNTHINESQLEDVDP